MKTNLCIITLLILLSFNLQSKNNSINASLLKEGDLIFQETRSEQAKAIRRATHSKYTHVGIILKQHNQFKVLEAVQPVSITNLYAFINRGVNQHYIIKRLNNFEILSESNIKKMKKIGLTYLGKEYDLYFEWDDNRIYCSELVWKIYKNALNIEVGKLQKLKDFDLSHPYVKKLLKKRYGNSIPWEEIVISPQSMFEATNLSTILEN